MTEPRKIVNYAAVNVRELRKQSGLSRQSIVDRLGEYGVSLHTTSLRRIEEGQQAVKIEEAQAFADLFGLGLAEFISSPVNPEIARSEQAVVKYREALRAVAEGTAEAAVAWARVVEATDPAGLPVAIRRAKSIQDAMHLVGSSQPVLRQMYELNQELVEMGIADGWRHVPQSVLEVVAEPFIKPFGSGGSSGTGGGGV